MRPSVLSAKEIEQVLLEEFPRRFHDESGLTIEAVGETLVVDGEATVLVPAGAA